MQGRHIENIPQETLEAVIDELAGNRAALSVCCLVSKRWVWRSRYHLFKRVRFSGRQGLKSLRNWEAAMKLDGMSLVIGYISHRLCTTTDTPATLTRSLCLSQHGDTWITPLTVIQYLDHFWSFNRVENLTLSHFSSTIFDQTSLHALFRNQIPSVRKLRLYYPSACPASLLQLISIFTNLRDTAVHAPRWVAASHQESYPATPRTLRGELHLSELSEDSGPFFWLLASQTPCYEQIVLERCTLDDFYPFQSFASNTGMFLRTLYVLADGDRKFCPLLQAHLSRRFVYRPEGDPEAIAVGLHSPGTPFYQCRRT